MKKLVLIIFIFMITSTACKKESNGKVEVHNSNEYTKMELEQMRNEFVLFKKDLLKRLQSAETAEDINDFFWKGEFQYLNDFERIIIKYETNNDFKKINANLDIKILDEVLNKGKVIKYKDNVDILCSVNKEYSSEKYPDISFHYNSRLKKWQFTSIRYIKL